MNCKLNYATVFYALPRNNLRMDVNCKPVEFRQRNILIRNNLRMDVNCKLIILIALSVAVGNNLRMDENHRQNKNL